ncbi:MAG TPA: hypothetical protein H9797_02760 [Candidatus Gallimonas gallistercoris]|uniref:Uncharacterized protein n=1 Tax=Candidatus Gallimonas gallistercoris TaxID=2838602 RepID=A0A9D2KGL1_9FIRM|nr:hypothetical protein [Candidatus Gallimonas gallistercoris]
MQDRELPEEGRADAEPRENAAAEDTAGENAAEHTAAESAAAGNATAETSIAETTAAENAAENTAAENSTAENASAENTDETSAADTAESAEPSENSEIPSENNAGSPTAASRAQNIAYGAKLPKRGRAFDKDGNRAGKVKKSVWYDEAGNRLGEFVKEEERVLFKEGERLLGYVDHNKNVFSNEHMHLATIRTVDRLWLLLLLVFLLLLTLVTGVVSTFFLLRSDADDVPVIRITDVEGTDWTYIENLPIFENDYFDREAILPGMRGEYRFILENCNNYALTYAIACTEENDFDIDIRYRLMRDGHHLAGEEGYEETEALHFEELTIEANSSAFFVLEWYWADDDPIDTEAGENGAEYTFTFAVEAARLDRGEDA